MKILVLGATGMLGSALMRILIENDDLKVFGTVRTDDSKKLFPAEYHEKLISGCEVTRFDDLVTVFKKVNPDVIINCISLSKELLKTADPLKMIAIYSMLPHQLSSLCKDFGARMIQISTDGVFTGKKGDYTEDDASDAQDIYGSAKFLGEVHESHVITIRTSIIGHELQSKNGLVEWFLSQKGQCICFSQSIFSGFPTVVLAQIIRDVVIPNAHLFGIYHISSNPISKCDLLLLISRVYGKEIKLIADDKIQIDRSLSSKRFRTATGYVPPDWHSLVKSMYLYR